MAGGGAPDDSVHVSLRQLSKHFGGVQAVADVSLDVRRGEILSIIGPNGAGKTTLLNMLSGFYHPDDGTIVLDGPAATLRENADIKEFYLGLTEVGARRSYRDVKHYRRRKRWLS